MADILEEANLDYKDQRKIQIFRTILPYIVALTLLIVGVYGVLKWRNHSILKEKEERTRILLESISGNINLDNLDDEIINSLSNGSDGIADIANIAKIHKLIEKNDYNEAIKVTDSFISSASNNIFKNFAKNLYISLSLDHVKLDEKTLTKIKGLVTSIDKTQPLYYNTRILYSLLLIKNNELENASNVIDEVLSYDKGSESIKMQANSIKNYLNLKGIK